MNDKRRVGENKRTGTDEIPLSEWMVSAVGLILVLGSLSFLLYKAIVVERVPPAIAGRLMESMKTDDGFLAKVEVVNRGGEAVSALTVKGEMKTLSQDTVVREVIVDYLPAHSSRTIGMFFPEQPDPASLRITFGGYSEP